MAADDNPVTSFHEFYAAKRRIAGADLTAAGYHLDLASVLHGRRDLEEAERLIADALQQLAISLLPAAFAIVQSWHPSSNIMLGQLKR
jgi:hypothetical protein